MGVEGGLALSVFLIGCVAISSLSARNGTSPAPYIYRSRGGHCFQWSAKKYGTGPILAGQSIAAFKERLNFPIYLKAILFQMHDVSRAVDQHIAFDRSIG